MRRPAVARVRAPAPDPEGSATRDAAARQQPERSRDALLASPGDAACYDEGMGMSSTKAGSPAINVTPLIDVLLVLLIIFLVLMPMMIKQETVALPPTEEGVGPPEPPITLELKADLSVSIDTNPGIPAA